MEGSFKRRGKQPYLERTQPTPSAWSVLKDRRFPAGWWLLPSVVLGVVFWLWLIGLALGLLS